MDLIDLCEGKIVNKRWVVEKKLGEGSCATVYKVHDVSNPRMKGALKVEAKMDDGFSILKREVAVMSKLQYKKNCVRIIYAARREMYSYVVMTLLGPNLNQLLRKSNTEFLTAGTVTRIGLYALYAIKQLHEIGFVHRDIKPANFVTGRRGAAARIIYLIDYGAAREYVLRGDGHLRVRKERENCMMRGTPRYCSPAVHRRREQGRKDDLWSLMYVLIEMNSGLPWRGCTEHKTLILKEKTPDEDLLAKCPSEWLAAFKHIRSLSYQSRPDYKLIYDLLRETLNRLKVQISDPYDWEIPSKKPISATQSLSGSTASDVLESDIVIITDAKEFELNEIGV